MEKAKAIKLKNGQAGQI